VREFLEEVYRSYAHQDIIGNKIFFNTKTNFFSIVGAAPKRAKAKLEKPMVQTKWKTVEETEENESCEAKLEENCRNDADLIDDHGLAIFGNRIRKPIFLDDDDES